MVGSCSPLKKGGEAFSGAGHCAERNVFAWRIER